ncbi:uncharacterized protein K460DRAFT_351994 [Cucurbitaria berberidis CBS 394.84]|uniref:Uncharacterized protein n=1 Tax=Cucurbitaria berberidis CBS 394.84 TaxID=1168544 RepID=A0A9P4GV75_9PLEO|nr:uncharacterized protein K460DRAFT_351994 [Cucurbitaria berberidis CBS 394.84]KAF1852166.1 hypothetical protein K460DRAFT_351994 [Cucurbitaria berberidis CBS 394.84]
MSCQPFTRIPSPPTALGSCAVPVGGSNSSILDACCNGHINAIATYSDPNSDTNLEDADGCFQFCITDSPDIVRTCLATKFSAYERGQSMFECFNGGSARKGTGYSNAGSARHGLGWGISVVLGLGFVGAVMGGV